MSDKIIIGVDGISYAGKTTLCNKIEKQKKFNIVYESPKFANIKIKISNSINSILTNAQTTLEIEKLRTNYVITSSDLIFIYDRTIFSFIAISYAYYKIGIVNYFNNYIDNILDGIKQNRFLIPDYLIYLNINKEELTKRKKIKKKSLPSYWTSQKFNDSINFILSKISEIYANEGRALNPKNLLNLKKDTLSKINNERIILLLEELKI